jgi:protein-L-isoaspartate(D-aspartate) O-methyltransferase
MGTSTKIVTGLRTSQDDLVDYLIRSRLVKSERVAAALREVDRGKYVNPSFATLTDAYADHPLAIGEGQTISAPHMHAICLELLEQHLQPGARVLDVGAGSGYLTAAMAKLVQPYGSVLGVEKVPELVEHAKRCIARYNGELLSPQARGGDDAGAERDQLPLLKVVHGNVLGDVLAAEGPFNAIHVGAAADELHQMLLDKLAPGGRMVIPVGPRYAYQVLMAVDKDLDGTVRSEALMDVGYVPLTRPSELEDGQLL